MPWFRNPSPDCPSSDVRAVLAELMRPGHFFAAEPLVLDFQHEVGRKLPWELFRGRLLDASQTRLSRTFEVWGVFATDEQGRSAEPVLALLLDAAAGQVHVARSILCYAWEGYHAGDNVYLSREVSKWVRELVGTVELARFPETAVLHDELLCLLFEAVVGTSRLPLTSTEAPLPAFSLGRLGYFHGPRSAGAAGEVPVHSWTELARAGLHADLNRLEWIKHLEFWLRAVPTADLAEATTVYVARLAELGHAPRDIPSLLRAVFDEVALSPYTDFADKVLRFVQLLTEEDVLSAADQVDLLGYLVRHLARHLTAYDLLTFHHRGANYPDALFLDALLKTYLGLVEAHPALFTESGRGGMRRRALRQGWLLRRFYEGVPVPDAPTSPGENARVLPSPHRRVPEEQIVNPAKRTRRLFDGDPLTAHLGEHGRQVLDQSIRDLGHAEELRELGMAVFLDRPLGVGKAPGEPDHTLLLSTVAFSRSVAEGRLTVLERLTAGLVGMPEWDAYRQGVACLPADGVGLGPPGPAARPGTVSLEDARKVADDIRFLHTTRRSMTDFLRQFDLDELKRRFPPGDLDAGRHLLLLGGEGTLTVYDDRWRRRLQLRVDVSAGYAHRAGAEYPVRGLQVLRVWDASTEQGGQREWDVESQELYLRPQS